MNSDVALVNADVALMNADVALIQQICSSISVSASAPHASDSLEVSFAVHLKFESRLVGRGRTN